MKDSMLHNYSHSEGMSKSHFWSWEHFGKHRKQVFLDSSKLKGWRKKLEMSKCFVISLSKKQIRHILESFHFSKSEKEWECFSKTGWRFGLWKYCYTKVCAFGGSDKKSLLDIFSLTREIVSISMRDRFVLKIKDKKPVHKKKLQELNSPFTINSLTLQNFLAIKKRFAKLSVTTPSRV